MELQAFIVFVIPFAIVVYLAFLLFIRPPMAVGLASLLGGLVMSVINALFDLLAYYVPWWHYTLSGLTLHLPLPFYTGTFLFFGSVDYLLIWRFRSGRYMWISRVLLLGTPIVGFLRDLASALESTGYLHWDSPLAGPFDLIMWLIMFYVGFLIFRQLAPAREVVQPEPNQG
jgi:hypothetical protein